MLERWREKGDKHREGRGDKTREKRGRPSYKWRGIRNLQREGGS